MQFNLASQVKAKPSVAEPVQTKAQVVALIERSGSQLHQLGVKRCGLFGSFVKETNADDSDVDILVDFEPEKKTFDNFMALSFLLEGLFGRNVDLVTTQSLSPHIGPHILSEVEYVSFDL
ncbi:MAG: nucleotidyltransferase family protein [Cyanobacteria bacterium P01_D01_bin.105]